jgi:hypothetical protein
MDTSDAFSGKTPSKSGVGEEAQSRGEGLALCDMNVEIPEEDVELLITALEHYFSYTVAKNAEDSRYRELAHRLKRKSTDREPARQSARNTKRRA